MAPLSFIAVPARMVNPNPFLPRVRSVLWQRVRHIVNTPMSRPPVPIVRSYRNPRAVNMMYSTLAGIGLTGLARSLSSTPAVCESAQLRAHGGGSSGSSNSNGDGGDDYFSKIIDSYGPELSQISMGGIFGFCSGYAIKEIGKAAAAAIGTVFVIGQVAASYGYIEINWKKMNQHVVGALDTNEDGKITKDDLKKWWKKFKTMMEYNLPSSGGFGIGFFLGVTYA